MQFTFLGTSSGVPTSSRNVSALAIRSAESKSWCLVDCGEATQHQLLHTGYSLAKLKAIFITHVHGDHCFGLPGLLASAAMANRKGVLKIVAPLALKEFLQVTMKATQLKLAYELEFVDVAQFVDARQTIPGIDKPLQIAGLSVSAIELSHRVPCYAYYFSRTINKRHLKIHRLQQRNIEPGPIWGRLQNGEDVTLEDGCKLESDDFVQLETSQKSVLVCGDNDKPALLSLANKPDVIVHESTYDDATLKKVGYAHQHCSAAQIAQYVQSAGVNNLVLTHFSPRYHGSGKNSDSDPLCILEQEARLHYDRNLFLAKDFDTYHLDQQGQLSLITSRG